MLVKKYSPVVLSVIFAGLVVRTVAGVVVSHESYAAFVTSATSCVPFWKLKTRVSPTRKVFPAAQVE